MTINEKDKNILRSSGNASKKAIEDLANNLEAIKSQVLTKDVLDVFDIIDTVDPISYLELQGNYYIQEDSPFLSEEQLSLVYKAKNDWISRKSEWLGDAIMHLNEPEASHRQAITRSSSDVVFKTLDRQLGSKGVISSGSAYGWCENMTQHHIVKMMYSNPKVAEVACIVGSVIYASHVKEGAFIEGRRIATKFIIQPGLAPLTPETNDFANSFFVGDFNGDGKDEIGLSNPDGFRIYRSESTAESADWYSRTRSAKKAWCTDVRNKYSVFEAGIRVGDFNGDRRADLWCHNKTSGINTILFNNIATIDGSVNGTVAPDNHEYNWYPPSFSLAGKEWCKSGQVRIGDFDGDGMSDVSCTKMESSGLKLLILFSLGDGRFVSRTGNWDGALALGAKMSGWDLSLAEYTAYDGNKKFSDRIHIGDFDGDGSSDILNIDTSGNNRFLFASPSEFFVKRSDPFMNGRTNWCETPKSTSNILVGDFNADGRADIVCMRESTLQNPNDLPEVNSKAYANLFMFSETKPLNPFTDSKINIRVSNFTLRDITITEEQFKTSLHTVVCDNRVRPDDRLECKAHHGFELKTIERLSTSTQWIRSEYSAKTSISHSGTGLLNHIIHGNTETQRINIESIETTSFSNHPLIKENDESFDSSISMSVKSGECVKMVMTNKYVSDVSVPYTAVAHFKGTENDATLHATRLLSLANQALSISGKAFLNPEDNSEVLFDVSGNLNVNLLVDSNSYAENC